MGQAGRRKTTKHGAENPSVFVAIATMVFTLDTPHMQWDLTNRPRCGIIGSQSNIIAGGREWSLVGRTVRPAGLFVVLTGGVMPRTEYRYTQQLRVRLTASQRARLEKKAADDGLTLSEYARKSLLEGPAVSLRLDNPDDVRILGSLIVDAVNDVWEQK